MFFKKNKKEETVKSDISAGLPIREDELMKDVEIHVMPSKFIISENNGNSKKKWFLFGTAVIIAAIFIFGAMFFIFKDNGKDNNYDLPGQNTNEENTNQNNNQNNTNYIDSENILMEEDLSRKDELPSDASTEEISPSAENITASSTENTIATSTDVISTSTENIIATSTESDLATRTEENLATRTEENLQATTTYEVLDSDKDGLTDAEEVFFASDKFDADFDKDGYLDGVEVVNLYNPISYTPQKLVESGLVKNYNESRYSLLYLTDWSAEVIEEGMITFKSDDGEFIELLISPNPDSMSPLDWYQIQIGMGEDALPDFFENLEQGTNKKGVYYIKINKKTVYISDYNYIYILNYNSAAQDKLNYPSVFEMMLQSFDSKIDTDGDGLKDVLEIDIYKTDPKNIDTDRDGHNDGEEIFGGYDPLK